MMSKVVKADEKRMYAIRCPSCKLIMNVIGTTLNEQEYIRCMHCKAIGRTANWIKGAPRWMREKS